MKVHEINEALVAGRIYRVKGAVRIGNLDIEPQAFDRVLMYEGVSEADGGVARYHRFRHLETGRLVKYRDVEIEHVELARKAR